MDFHQEEEYNKRFDFKLWKKLLKFAVPYKRNLIAVAVFMVLIAAVDAIFPLMTKLIIDRYVVNKSNSGFLLFCFGIAAIILLQFINVKIMILVAGRIEIGVPYDIRKAGFKKLQELPLTYYDRTPLGWLMARMTSDVKKLGTALSWNLVDISWAISVMFIMLILMFFLEWRLALIILAIVPFLIIISIYFQGRILKNFRKVRKINSQITGAFNEGIMGAKTIKTLVREKESLNDFKKLTAEFRNTSVRSAVISSVYTPLVILLGSVGTGMVLWHGGAGVLSGNYSYGTLVAFIAYTVQFFEPVKQFARVFNELQYAQASAERILSLVDSEPDIKDCAEIVERYGDVFAPKKENWPPLYGNISFKNVSFSYKDGEQVLKNFNLEIKAGETIAIVGSTGSGKTTIINLACRFYEPTEGLVLIDGIDYRERSLLWLHSNLGYVLQEPHLFSGTVKDNISYGRANVTDEEIINAAKLVNAHQFITTLENGYDTDVGERGGRLSTGQKQLISFARAILANPAIFILDEATSSVDTETEQLIQEAINKVLKGRTSFIIAHRLSTIKTADRILVLENGEIIEAGSHKQLLQKRGHYYSLYTNQFLEQQEEKILCASNSDM